MTQEFGSYLLALRQTRGLSTSQLAQKAGIRRATLSEWQAGKRRPRLPEMEAVLLALGASQAQKRNARELLSVSGEVVRLRQEWKSPISEFTSLAGHAPHSGTLLRALRLRKGWTQAEIAEKLGVTQATVARWESAENFPSMEQIHHFCFLTGAHEQEIIALTVGDFRAGKQSASPSAETILYTLENISLMVRSASDYSLSELRFLTMAAQAWQLAQQNRRNIEILASVYTEYANFLYMNQRFREAGKNAAQALDIYESLHLRNKFSERAIIRSAQVSAHRIRNNGLGSAIEMLEELLAMNTDQQNLEWLYSDLGLLKARYGQTEEAIALGKKSIALARQNTPFDARYRPNDLALVLIYCQHFQDAQDVMQEAESLHPNSFLVRAELALALGDPDAALHHTGQASAATENRLSADESEVIYYSHQIERMQERAEAARMSFPS